MNASSDMDHYVPKEKFPEYSVHPLNLIPICSICNIKKSNIFIEKNKRVFFNPYTDEIKTKVLFLELEYVKISNSFLFNIYVDENFSFKSHIEKLGIVPRYKEEAMHNFDDLKSFVIDAFENFPEEYCDLKVIEKYIRDVIESRRLNILEKQGINTLSFLVCDSFVKSKYFDITFLVENFGNASSKVKLEKLKQR